MSVTFVDVASGTADSSASVATSGSVTHASDHLYLAAVVTHDNEAVTGVTGMGLTWTLVRAQCSGAGNQRVEVWKAVGGSGSTGAVTATVASPVDGLAISVARYSGAAPAAPIGASVGYNTNGSGGACSGGVDTDDATGVITTTAANSVVAAAFGTHEETLSGTSGWTTRVDDITAGPLVPLAVTASLEDKAVAAAGATTVGAANNMSAANDWALVAVEILSAPRVAPAATPRAIARFFDPHTGRPLRDIVAWQ